MSFASSSRPRSPRAKWRGPRVNHNGAGGTVTEFAVKLRPGMRKAIPLGSFGEIGVEAA